MAVRGSLWALYLYFFLRLLTLNLWIRNESNYQMFPLWKSDYHHGSFGLRFGQETILKMTGIDWNGAIMSSSSSRSPSKGNLVSVNKYLSCFISLLSNDINLNPGPPAKAIKWQVCFKSIHRNLTSATCCLCNANFHTKCWDISEMTLSITCQFCTGSNDSTVSNAFDETEQRLPELVDLLVNRGLKILPKYPRFGHT